MAYQPRMGTLNHTAFVNLPSIGRGDSDILMDLRDSTRRTISLSSLDGIICFPSLHAVVSAVVPFVCRWSRALFFPILALDATMFVSAVSSGNHYVVDTIGGFAVALLAIACGRDIERWLNQLVAGLLQATRCPRAGVERGRAALIENAHRLPSQVPAD